MKRNGETLRKRKYHYCVYE